MRLRAKVIVAALVMIPAVLTQTPASASWCAEYSSLGGTESCGFSTFEQCQATVSGVQERIFAGPVNTPIRATRLRDEYKKNDDTNSSHFQ